MSRRPPVEKVAVKMRIQARPDSPSLAYVDLEVDGQARSLTVDAARKMAADVFGVLGQIKRFEAEQRRQALAKAPTQEPADDRGLWLPGG